MNPLHTHEDRWGSLWKKAFVASLVFFGLVIQGTGLLSERAWSSDMPADLRNRIFLSMKADKERAYRHERISLTVTLYMEGLSVRDVAYPQIPRDGFSLRDFGNPVQQTETVGGKIYDTLVFMTTITADKAGMLTLKPATLHCNVLLPSASGSAAFFGQNETYALDLQSDTVALDIMPFPKEGRPPLFHNVVGKFTLTVDVHPRDVKIGDPVKVTTTIRGTGNLRDVHCPPAGPANGKDSPFRVYAPQRLQKEDAVICEQVLIPLSAAANSLPPISFSYFNAGAAAYATLRQGPFPLKIAKPSSVEMTEPEGEEEKGIPDPYEHRPGFYLLSLCLLILLVIVFAVVYSEKSNIRNSIKVCILRLRNLRKRDKALRQAKKLLDQGLCAAFHTVIFKTLQEYLGETFQLPYGGITADIMGSTAKPPGAGEGYREKIETIFSRCDMARYAAVTFSKEEMRGTLTMLKDVLKDGQRFI